MRTRGSGNHGQSEVLGYIIIFSILMLSVGAIYVSGITSLETHQANSELNNAEQAMFIFAGNVEDIVRQEAPSRSVELKTTDSTVGMNQRYNISLTNDGERWNTSINGFVYRGEAGGIVYDGGAVIRTQDGDGAMRRSPLYTFSEKRVILNVVDVVGTDEFNGNGTPLAVLQHDSDDVQTKYSTVEAQNITITFKPYPGTRQAWTNYFESQGLVNVSSAADSDTISYRYVGTDEVLIRKSVVSVYIEE